MNTLANLVALCSECHGRIESYRTWALEHGFLLHEGESPEDVPIMLMGRRMVLLGATYRTFDPTAPI